MDLFSRLLGGGSPKPNARPGWPPAPQGQYPASWSSRVPAGAAPASTIMKGAGRLMGPAAVLSDIYTTGRQVFNPQDNIVTRLQDLGAGVGNLLQGRPYLSGARMNAGNSAVGSIPPSANGESYRRAELRLADAARPGGGGGGGGNAGYSVPRPLGGTPQERAQAAETSRIAQLTAQDPELQRYERARQMAVAPGATPEQVQSAEDIGMQIWRAKYGKTPMAQPGGAVGIDNPLMQSTFGYQSGSAPDQQMGAPTLGPSPLVPQVDPSLNPAGPNYIGGEGPPLMNFADPRFENMSPEDFEKLLNQVNKK